MNLRTTSLRTLTITAAAAALAAFPAAAASAEGGSEYPPPEYCAISASPSSLIAGEATTVKVVDKANVTTKLTVTSTSATIPSSSISIAGTQTATKTTGGDGTASFSVTLSAAGNYSLDATMGDGKVCALGVAVTDPTAVLGVEDVAGAETLALTGANAPLYLAVAAAMAGAGAAVVVVSRRRRKHS